MRMWMVNPVYMCDRHLLGGEHVEIHMLVSSIGMGRNIGGFLERKLVDPSSALRRHEEIVGGEMLKRGGFRHTSPLEGGVERIQHLLVSNPLDAEANLTELLSRCQRCRQRYREVRSLCPPSGQAHRP
ncbi:hypothetical protein [Thermogymnomonas acidicola]|uniref:pyrimidine dimer DNA glycosylase/endonuclease V n=1 Tax=Thermogymnomonas acidicola TaxID=399579 RepID=UPI00094687F3|nr:pyrimidine dimer DNA glycosylase/endonuclease V [Thermogymnomonas acidicola]